MPFPVKFDRNMPDSDDGNGGFVVRVRGLPWSCTEQQLREFFREEGGMDKVAAVHFTYNREGRPSGEAYLKFMDSPSYEAALGKDKEYLNKRYVEVFPSKQAEMEYVIKHSGKSASSGWDGNEDAVVRMRGLPYGCTKEEIASFFLGLEISPNGIVMLSDPYTGRATGEAFVQFNDKTIAEKALQKHLQKIGHRYIEVFRSSSEEMRRFLRRAGMDSGYGGSPGGGGGGPMYANWSAGASGPPSLFASGYGPGMGNGSGGMLSGGYGGGGELSYVGRTSRVTPYDRPNGGAGYASARSRPTPLAAALSAGPYRGYNGGGRMVGAGSMGSQKGYPEGGYASGPGGGGGRAGGRPGGSGHYVHMRGLPYNASEKDIVEFFKPLRIAGVEILFENSGRPSGEAEVEFYTHTDAQEAMKRDRHNIGPRYVELFLNSSNAAAPMMYSGFQDFSSDHY